MKSFSRKYLLLVICLCAVLGGYWAGRGLLCYCPLRIMAPFFSLAAKTGNAGALTISGLMLSEGLGTKTNKLKAADDWKIASDKGEPAAFYMLGRAYEFGEGVAKDNIKAANLYKKAAESQNTRAQWRLGVMYLKGRGVEESFEQGRHYLQKSSDGGCREAKAMLEEI